MVQVNGLQPAPPAVESPTAAMIAVDHVSRWYGDVVAVSDVSFEIGAGITGLLGPNGAGKTTILKMLAGLLAPSQGSVQVLGRPVRDNTDIYRDLSLVMEAETVYPFLTGREFVRLNARLQHLTDDAPVERALADVDLLGAADRRIGGYSKGMRQRIKLAAGLVHRPRVLMLDEPFSGTDPRQRMHLMDLLRRYAAEGNAVLFSSHILEEVEQLAGDVIVIVAGKLRARGGVSAIRAAMLDRPHHVRVRTSDPRRLAAVLIGEEKVAGVAVTGEDSLSVQAAELLACARVIPTLARAEGITLFEVTPEDESLESVFAYLVGR